MRPIGDEEESSLGDFVEDRQTVSPSDAAVYTSLEEQTRKVLATLTPREEQILRMRFGIGEKSDYTLEEVAEATEFLAKYTEAFSSAAGSADDQASLSAWSALLRTLLTRNEFLFVD